MFGVVQTRKTIFEEMREKLTQSFTELTSKVNQRKCDLDRKIDDLEIEYNNKNKQIEKDKQTMRELREMTEQKLGQNALMDVQNNIIKEISDKIQKLDVESKSQLKLTLNFNIIKQEIDRIDIKLVNPVDEARVILAQRKSRVASLLSFSQKSVPQFSQKSVPRFQSSSYSGPIKQVTLKSSNYSPYPKASPKSKLP